jgi:hypothetical protein
MKTITLKTTFMKLTQRSLALLSALLILYVFPAKAQLDTRSFFSITGGYSLPVGEMAREKLNDPFAGLSGSGYYGQANFDFRIARWVGLRFTGSSNLNTTNSEPIIEKANQYAQVLGQSFNWQTDVSKWKLHALMAGPALYLNMNRVQFEVHAQAGKIWANSPSVNVVGTAEAGGEPIYVTLKPSTTSAFALGGGASLRLPLAGALYFQLSGDVIGAEAEIRDVVVQAKRGTFEFSEPINERRFVGVVNVGAGFGIAF